jgi:hypothetical protein
VQFILREGAAKKAHKKEPAMLQVRSILRPLVVAMSLAFIAAPAAAYAGEGHAQAGAKDEKPREGKRFPVAAEKFQKHVEKRIEHAREKLEQHMKEKNLADDKRAAIRKEFDSGAAEVRAAAKRVGQDGTVTKEEAQEVRELAKSMRQKAHEKLGGKHRAKDHDKKEKKDR